MSHDDVPIGTVLSRREALALATVSGFGLLSGRAMAARGPMLDIVATPEMTEGPFFIDSKLNRPNLLEGSSRKAVREGTPLLLEIDVYRIENGKAVPLPDAQVDLWHADAAGLYSGQPSQALQAEDTTGEMFLRGWQRTDAKGRARFETIYPGYYRGRTTHIHFKIRHLHAGKTHDFTSQWYFDEALNARITGRGVYAPRSISNARDGIFAEKQADGSAKGSHLMLRVEEPKGKPMIGRYAVGLIV
jgi:protocatechuate 3,4-dioxygenase beta subunit